MWPFEGELSTWFDLVDERRKERYGGGSDDAPMTRNEWGKDDD